jgi:alpha,alpha-trehalase
MEKCINRRSFVRLAFAGVAASAASLNRTAAAAVVGFGNQNAADEEDLKARWLKLDAAMRGWWDGDLERADEEAIRKDATEPPPTPVGSNVPWSHSPPKTLVYLPFPYSSGGGSVGSFPEMYGWDAHFINLGLFAHDRTDIVRWNILDQLAMIERFGKVLNGNRTFYETRGQPPLLAMSVEKYLEVKKDDDELALLAYPLLERSYTGYWNAPAHRTPIGLSTCRDGGTGIDSDNELASEAESGLDFTPIFGGDIRHCVPIHLNCALMRQAQVLGSLAARFGWKDKAARWQKEALTRAWLINHYCWDEKEGCYFEYDYVRQTRLPYYSLNAYWPLWIGIASKAQAARVIDHLHLFDHAYGLTFTDKKYPEIHSEFNALEWAYPESWPQQQVVVGQALERYGSAERARAISRRYMANVIATWEKTGLTWERYDGVVGGHNVPVERDPAQPLHGFSSASAVVVGRIAFAS